MIPRIEALDKLTRLSQEAGMYDDLTQKQRSVLMYILDCKDSTGNLPTRRQIANYFGHRSANAAEEHIKALRRKGYLAPKTDNYKRIELPQRIHP